jgi:hypothetical protein
VLLSTINWTNKGSSTSDTDGFDAAFGPIQAERARGIVQRSIDDWERIILNFNRSGGGTNTYNLVVDAADLDGALATTRNVTYDAQGKPLSARITLDRTAPWYFDPLIGPSHLPDDGEFTFIESPFQAANIAVNRDLYTVVTHEVGHAMGLASSSNRLLSLGVDIGDDPNDDEDARLFTIDVNGVPGADFTYTRSNNSGTHLYEGPSVNGCPTHPMDLMNGARAHQLGRRNLITNTIAILLRDVYGYTIQLPSQQNTFYVNLDTIAQRVTINGDINPNGNDDDTIDLRISGSQRFSVNGTTESISIPNFFSTVVNANNGNDFITVDSMWGSLEIFGGAGHDTLDICPQERDLIEAPHGIIFNASQGVDSVRLNDSNATRTDTFTITSTFVGRPAFTLNMTGQVENLELIGQNGMNVFNLTPDPLTHYTFDGAGGLGDSLVYNDTAATTGRNFTIRRGVLERVGSPDLFFANTTETLVVNAGSGDDQFTFIPGDIYGLVGMNGGAGGNDSLTIDDRADAGDDDYTHFGNLFQKSVFGLPQGGNLPTTHVGDFEQQTLYANNGNNVIGLYKGPDIPLRVFAEGGNDRVEVNDSTAVVNTGPETQSTVFPFGDTLVVNEDAATGEDIPGIAIIEQDDEVRDLEVLNAQTMGTLRIKTGAVLLRSAGQGSGFDVAGVIDLAGGALLMRSPAGTLDGWRAGIINGRNGGAWNGVAPNGAINSSLAATTPIGDGVGYGLGSQLGFTTIGSFAIGAADTLVRYALDGDANLDGRVNLQDFNRVAANFGAAAPFWTRGDFNYDDRVNLLDFNALAGNFGATAATPDGSPATSFAIDEQTHPRLGLRLPDLA